MSPPTAPLESDLAGPVRDYLERQGYTVRSEVHDCDLVATRGDEFIVVELKRRLNVDLLAQAATRQKLTPNVYVAVPRPDKPVKRWRGVRHLLRRLELGLIWVTPGRGRRVQVVFHPAPFDRKRNHRASRAVLAEAAGRRTDGNTAGSNKRPLLTAYRENALLVALALSETGPEAPKNLRARGTGSKTLPILYDNVYGWFTRLERGIYALSEAGNAALEEYADVLPHLRAALTETGEEKASPEAT
ncbi:MAG: DUF2161 family putative PD-(D/E)XK-type phosphodiesterase [Candidatus Hydrogenedentota bacterium]